MIWMRGYIRMCIYIYIRNENAEIEILKRGFSWFLYVMA